MIPANLSTDLYWRLRDIARAEDTSVADVVARLIEAGLNCDDRAEDAA